MSSSASAPLLGKTFKYGMPIYGLAWPSGSAGNEDRFYVCGGGGMGIKNRLVCAESRKGQLTDQVAELHFGGDCPMKLIVHPDGKALVFAMGQGGIQQVDHEAAGKAPRFTPAEGEDAERTRAIKGDVKSMSFDATGRMLALGFSDGCLGVYEWPSLKQRMYLSGEQKLADGIRDLDFSLPPSPSTSNATASTASRAGAVPGPGPGAAAGQGSAAGACAGAGAVEAGALLAVALDNGVCELWDWRAARRVCSLEPGKMKQKLERAIVLKADGQMSIQQLPPGTERVQVAKLRFTPDSTGHLLTLLNSPLGAYMARWAPPPVHTSSHTSASTSAGQTAGAGPGAGESVGESVVELPQLVSCHKVSEYPCTCFDISRDGSWLAFGTSEGGVVLAHATSCAVAKKVPKAHMVFTTGITFSPAADHVLSVSADASATVTDVGRFTGAGSGGRGGGSGGAGTFVFLLLSLLALLLALALAALGYLPPQATSALHQVPGAEAVLRSIREKVAPLLGAGKDEL